MERYKVYRIIGWALLLFGIVGYFTRLLFQGLSGQLQFNMVMLTREVSGFFLNIPVWIGLVLLWRANKNQNPAHKSIWLRVFLIYAIIAALVVGVIIALAVAFFVLWDLTSLH